MSGLNEPMTYRTNTKNATTGARAHMPPPSGNPGLASGLHTESRFSHMESVDGLTYSASAVSDASELRENTISRT